MTDPIVQARAIHHGWQIADWVELAQRLADDLENVQRALANCLEWAERDRPKGEAPRR